MQITDLVVDGFVQFIKRYPEYVIQKTGIVLSINTDEGTVLIKTGNKTIYKLVFMDAEFEIMPPNCLSYIIK